MSQTPRLQRGLLAAVDHSIIVHSCTNFSPAKASYSMPRSPRFDWQINPMHKRISHTNLYTQSCFLKKKPSSTTTFGATQRFVERIKQEPAPGQYELGSSFRVGSPSEVAQKVSSVRDLSHHRHGELCKD